MASPGELVHTVAQVLGIPKGTVIQHDRNLASAGLRTKGGRGRSAARVTARDAAYLLIAICGAPISGASVKETVTTCKRYSALRAYGLGNFSRLKSQLPTLATLPDGHSFRDAIAALIESLAAGEFDFEGRRSGTVHVGFDGPNPMGSIHVGVRKSARLWYRESEEWIWGTNKDLRQHRGFSIETLSEIARLVGKQDPSLAENS